MPSPDATAPQPDATDGPPDVNRGPDGGITRTPYLAGLNAPQREAVEVTDGPLLVLAGAGTGKTRVLTTRLAHLLVTGKARPNQILCVTFTNKAAREMRERVGRLLGHVAEGWWIGTFHALSARILRRHAEMVGLKPSFTILDTDDQIRLVKQLIQAADIDEKKWPARGLAGVFERWKDRGLAPDEVNAGDRSDYANGRALELYEQYQERLRTLNAVDFGDLLLHTVRILRADAEILARYHDTFRYLLVDEYQDTNVAQYLWLRLLAQKHRNICCVGDEDQSIYAWRGAEIGNILRFEKDFPGARVVRLEQNYRSTPQILKAASGLIAKNRDRLGKTLWTEESAGDRVVLRGLWDGQQEARDIGEQIEDLQRAEHPLSQVAVLVRASFQMRAFEERFITIGLPYRVIGGPRFYERLEIRDALAYLRVVAQPDDDLAFERIVNKPKRGIGATSLRALHTVARADRVSLREATSRLVETDELRGPARASLRALLADFARWREQIDVVPHAELATLVLDESGYTAMWQADRSPEAPGRLENLKELIRAMEEFDSLEGFLEHVSLVMEAATEAPGEMVSLMTLHSAKGLEFDTVFLPGWEEGLFPHQRALDEAGTGGLEEERRLAYVGLTRARRRALVSYAANRFVHGQWQASLPSRFLDELPKDAVDVQSEPGLYGAQPGFREGALSGYGAAQDLMDTGRWRRAQDARRGAGRTIDGVATRVNDLPTGSFAAGDRVFHQKFGYGEVTAGEGDKLHIRFDKAGEKKVMAAFVVSAADAG